MTGRRDLHRANLSFRPPPYPQQKRNQGVKRHGLVHCVAGRRPGKTARLTCRILKLVLVDIVPSPGRLASTFTKKAVKEFRSRSLVWRVKIIDFLKTDQTLTAK
jgi:hypothetical protein